MKKFTCQLLIAAAMALGVSGVAQADQRGSSCTLRTLRGVYVFTASGFNIVDGVAQPFAIVEVIDFNGDGTLSVTGTLSENGVIVRIPPGEFGNYSVDGDCTGTITFDGPSLDSFISADGEEIWMIQNNPDTVLQGTAKRRAGDRNRH